MFKFMGYTRNECLENAHEAAKLGSRQQHGLLSSPESLKHDKLTDAWYIASAALDDLAHATFDEDGNIVPESVLIERATTKIKRAEELQEELD